MLFMYSRAWILFDKLFILHCKQPDASAFIKALMLSFIRLYSRSEGGTASCVRFFFEAFKTPTDDPAPDSASSVPLRPVSQIKASEQGRATYRKLGSITKCKSGISLHTVLLLSVPAPLRIPDLSWVCFRWIYKYINNKLQCIFNIEENMT